MVVDFKNKKITIEKGTTPSQLFDFLKTIIHEGIQEFSLDIVTPHTGIKTPMISGDDDKRIKDFIDGYKNIKNPYVDNPYKVTYGTTTEGTVSSLPNSTFIITATN